MAKPKSVQHAKEKELHLLVDLELDYCPEIINEMPKYGNKPDKSALN